MDFATKTVGKCLCHRHSEDETNLLEQTEFAQLSNHLIISTNEARKILSTDVQNLSDEELEEFIFAATSISQQVLQLTVQNNSNGA